MRGPAVVASPRYGRVAIVFHWTIAVLVVANLAIGLQRLGVQAAWISRVGADPLGTRVVREIRGEGVEADLALQRFRLARRRLGYHKDAATLDCSRFGPPQRAGDQLSLF